MTTTMTENAAQSRVELVSDGSRSGTNVFLVIEDGEGHELRYKIPNVQSVEFRIDAKLPNRACSVLQLGLGNVDVVAKVEVGRGKSTIEDLMSEIAAARLRSSDR